MGQIRTRAIRSAFDVHRASQLRCHPRLQLLLEVLLDRDVGRSQGPADGELKVCLEIWDGRICERDAPDVGLTSNREHVEYLQLQSELAQRFVRHPLHFVQVGHQCSSNQLRLGGHEYADQSAYQSTGLSIDRHEAREFLEPIQDNGNLQVLLVARLDHHEPLSVWRQVVRSCDTTRSQKDLPHAALADEGGDVVMAEPGADVERHRLLGRTLPELYVRVRPPGYMVGVFGVQPVLDATCQHDQADEGERYTDDEDGNGHGLPRDG